MEKKPLIYLIYDDLVDAVRGIGDKVFLDRPKNTPEELQSFVVVNIPTEIRSRLKGKFDVSSECYGSYSIFCKAKSDRTLNIGIQSTLVQKVLDVFPINGVHVTATNPTLLMQGEDGFGFQVTQITFKLRTKLNARDIKPIEVEL